MILRRFARFCICAMETKIKKGDYTEFVTRANWGADPMDPPDSLPKLTNPPIERMVITWTEQEACKTRRECEGRVKELQEKHISLGLQDIAYHFIVGGDKRVYEGRGWKYQGPPYPDHAQHSSVLSGDSIEVALIEKHTNEVADDYKKRISSVVTYGIQTDNLCSKIDVYFRAGDKIHFQNTYDEMVEIYKEYPGGGDELRPTENTDKIEA